MPLKAPESLFFDSTPNFGGLWQQYYSKVVFFLIAYYLNKIIIIDMYEQFIVVTSYDELITNKVYNKYAIIYIQHSPKKKKIIT